MHGNTHAIFGAALFAAGAPLVSNIIGYSLSPAEMLAGTGLTLWITSLLPDNDSQHSYIAKGNIPYIPRSLGFLGKGFGKALSLPPRVIGYFIRGVMGHRQGTHSLLFMLIWTILAVPVYVFTLSCLLFVLSVPAALIGLPIDITDSWFAIWNFTIPHIPLISISVFIGYFSHLFSDSLNHAPVPWLWPLNKKGYFFLPPGFRIPVSTPESYREFVFRMACVVALAVFMLLNVLGPILNSVTDGNSNIREAITMKKNEIGSSRKDVKRDPLNPAKCLKSQEGECESK